MFGLPLVGFVVYVCKVFDTCTLDLACMVLVIIVRLLCGGFVVCQVDFVVVTSWFLF